MIIRPELRSTESEVPAVEVLYLRLVGRGDGGRIEYDRHQSVWKFLSYIGEKYPLLFSGLE
ncbi:MAG: hypothetical protein ACO3L6_05125 [Dehalococcoidia bacterium]